MNKLFQRQIRRASGRDFDGFSTDLSTGTVDNLLRRIEYSNIHMVEIYFEVKNEVIGVKLHATHSPGGPG